MCKRANKIFGPKNASFLICFFFSNVFFGSLVCKATINYLLRNIRFDIKKLDPWTAGLSLKHFYRFLGLNLLLLMFLYPKISVKPNVEAKNFEMPLIFIFVIYICCEGSKQYCNKHLD